MTRLATVFIVAMSALLTWGCGSVHAVDVRVVDSTSRMPIESAKVQVERRSLYFASLRAKPDFPGLQSIRTDSEGVSKIDLVDGDNFWIQVTHPEYLNMEQLYTPWKQADYGLFLEFALERDTSD